MIHVIWEFRVLPERRQDFEERYGSGGDWARLFGLASGFGGTMLLRDPAESARYLTIDAWQDRDAYFAFREQHASAYERLDAECAALTTEERCLGWFEVA